MQQDYDHHGTSDMLRDTLTRESSNGFYRKSPKVLDLNQDQKGSGAPPLGKNGGLSAAIHDCVDRQTKQPYFQYDSKETSMMRESGHFNGAIPSCEPGLILNTGSDSNMTAMREISI